MRHARGGKDSSMLAEIPPIRSFVLRKRETPSLYM
jgi:hypothetical protein